MKSFYFALIVLALVASSCDQDPSAGSVRFSFAGNQDSYTASIKVTIKNSSGTVIYDRVQLAVEHSGSDFLSAPLPNLAPGKYTITEFFAGKASNMTVYAAPLEGSTRAVNVSDPLPIDFTIKAGQTTTIAIEALEIEYDDPDAFGYTTYGYSYIPTFVFWIAVTAYDDESQDYLPAETMVAVGSDDLSLFGDLVEANTTGIRIHADYTQYRVIAWKEGYVDYSQEFTMAELKVFTHDDPLIVELDKE